MEAQVDVLGSPSPISLMVSVDTEEEEGRGRGGETGLVHLRISSRSGY